jgi:hypothetical protein
MGNGARILILTGPLVRDVIKIGGRQQHRHPVLVRKDVIKPENATPPYQAIVFLGGMDNLVRRESVDNMKQVLIVQLNPRFATLVL